MKTCISFNRSFFLLLQNIHCYYFHVCVCSVMPINNTNETVQVAMLLKLVNIQILPRQDKKSKFTCKMTRAFSIERSSEGKPSLFQTNSSLSVHRNRRKSNSDKQKCKFLSAFTVCITLKHLPVYTEQRLCLTECKSVDFPLIYYFIAFIELIINK